MDQAIEREIEGLADLGLEDLRAVWRTRYGCPPKLRSPELLRRMLAWRIQVAAFGDLDPETKRKVRRPISAAPKLKLNPGTLITREHNGLRHQIEVTEQGFIHEGRAHKSLSSVARAITGVRWNGPRFFGLRQIEP